MVETKVKKAPAASKGAKAAKGAKPRIRTNPLLAPGVHRYSASHIFRKSGAWKFVGKTTEKKVTPRKPLTVEKKIGGEKNGGTRVVLLKKRTSSYPTSNSIRKHPSKNCFSQHKRYTRKTLTPGTVLILLAGRHKGKRVVLMKVLKSGLLLVNGPFKLNACPLRRIHQNFVIATSTKIDISSVNIPEKINDKYFQRVKDAKKGKKDDGEIFAKKAERYTPSEERKKDQAEIDKQLIAAIKKNPEKKLLFIYLRTLFGLRNQQYPHRMKF
ncbi:hypothetical protein ONE63_010790 [Megalurothrips usitatus]|uniref:60S ribosomal protein L6 n=1 Tax=Megalurothrips usitatus TaxID=439358 RepID=A0AAV7XE38_9NEOP|nr:hypothetical protein ONE63_010790 [Megalurothrips usitatus]